MCGSQCAASTHAAAITQRLWAAVWRSTHEQRPGRCGSGGAFAASLTFSPFALHTFKLGACFLFDQSRLLFSFNALLFKRRLLGLQSQRFSGGLFLQPLLLRVVFSSLPGDDIALLLSYRFNLNLCFGECLLISQSLCFCLCCIRSLLILKGYALLLCCCFLLVNVSLRFNVKRFLFCIRLIYLRATKEF